VLTFPKYKNYQGSGVEWLEEIPSHWRVQPGRAYLKPQKVKNIGNQVTTVLSLSYGKIVVKPEEKLHGLVPESFETYQIVEPGNIIVRATDLQNDQTSLRIGLVENKGIITSAYLCLVPSKELNSKFAYYLLHAYDLLKVYYGMGSGLRQNLDYIDFKYLPLTVPPIEDQRRIVEFLDRKTSEIDQAIAQKQRLIELLREQKAILINKAVTKGLNSNDPMRDSGFRWIGEIPANWKSKRLKFAVKRIYDCKNRTPDYIENGEYFVVRTSNIRNGKLSLKDGLYTDRKNFIEWTQKGQPLPGEIVFTREAPVGEVAMVPNNVEMCLGQRMMGIKPDEKEVLGTYLLYFLQSQSLKEYVALSSAGSTVGHLRVGQVFDIPIAYPASIEEQNEIANLCAKYTEEIEKICIVIQNDIDKIQEFRQITIANTVIGKIKV
jgi:type I restriction enzyme, S subunit